MPTLLYHCRRCDLYVRAVDYHAPLVRSHFTLMGYTNPADQLVWRKIRDPFFEQLYALARRRLGAEPHSVLDFGSSFGHLLDVFHRHGAGRTIAVDICPRVIEQLLSGQRHEVYSDIESVPVRGGLDVITAIDSLYYVPGRLAEVVEAFARRLRPGGVLIVRTINRNQVLRGLSALRRLGGHPRPVAMPAEIVGDARFGFSQRSLGGILRQAGFSLLQTCRHERKAESLRRRLLRLSAAMAYHVSLHQLDFSPGLVLVARKSSRPGAPGDAKPARS